MTPQTQLTLSKVFDNTEIRAMDLNGEIWVPVVDLAEAWGVDRTTLGKIINRNPDVFKNLSTVVDVTSSSQNLAIQQTVGNSLRLVNEQGMHVLMLKVSAGHIKNPAAKERIIDFQLWIPQLIQDLKKGMVIYASPLPMPISQVQHPLNTMNEQLDLADLAVKRSGIPKEIAHAMAWATEDAKEIRMSVAGYIKAQSKQLLLTEGCNPVDQADFDSHFSLKYIANILKLSEDKTRNILESKNILCYKNKMWHLTTYGEKYGKAFKVQIGYPYRSIQQTWIRYNPELIKVLRLEYHIETKVE